MAIIGSALLNKLIADKSKVDAETVAAVIAAQTVVIKAMLQTGCKLRVFELGLLYVRKSKPTRRRNPNTGELMEVPAKDKTVFTPTLKPRHL